MKTKEEILNDINKLIDFIKDDKRQALGLHQCNILTIKNDFYSLVDTLTSEFTEQELNRIETDLIFYYQTLKEIIDTIYHVAQNQQFVTLLYPKYGSYLYSSYDRASYDRDYIEQFLIQPKDLEEYPIYIQRRIASIINEIEKNQKIQLRYITETYTIYNGLADNLDQQIIAMDEHLYNSQTQQYEAMIKNIINNLDGV